ncbi:MAG TPA: hypothetical protein VF624_14815 [Tepidisphaeraceae bacterium]|jgi:hypothetical protein
MSKSVLILAAILLVTGCASRQKPAPMSAPPTAEQVMMIRESFMKVSPTAKVGVVGTVLDTDTYVFINDMPTDGIAAGDVVTFVDADQATVAHGKVVDIREGKVAAMYTTVTRAPVVGDLAVKF